MSEGQFLDSRDGSVYKTVELSNGDIWTKENFRYVIDGSLTENPDNATSQKEPIKNANCGRLYSWGLASEICPKGWRLPNNSDWKKVSKSGEIDKLSLYQVRHYNPLSKVFNQYGGEYGTGTYWSRTESFRWWHNLFPKFMRNSKGSAYYFVSGDLNSSPKEFMFSVRYVKCR